MDSPGKSAEMPGRTRLRSKGLLSLLALVLWLGVLEGGARYGLGRWFGPVFQAYLVHDASRGWRPRPNGRYLITSKARNFQFDVGMDAAGFRLDGGRPGGARAVPAAIVLGDSNAFGYALKSGETFAAALSRALQGRAVLNAGCPGYDCVQPVLTARGLEWRPGQLFVFLVHPVNDLVNTANQIDYSAYKPFLRTSARAVLIDPPPRGVPKTSHRFAPDFQDLNEQFQLPAEEFTLADAAGRVSALAFILKTAPALRWFSRPAAAERIDWDDMPLADFRAQALAPVHNAPFATASRFWPEIERFAPERSRLVAAVGALYAELQAELRRRGCRMLVVVAPEPHRRTAFHRELTDRLQAGLPEYTFAWGASADALREELRRRAVPVLCPEYDPQNLEAMFIPWDGHTSGAAFALIAEAVAREYGGAP